MRLTRSLLLTPLVAGCYTYTAISPASATPGTEIRAHINGAASDRVAPLTGSFDRELTGSVVENRNGEMLLDVELGTRPNVAASVSPLRTRVPLAPADIVSIEQRKLDRVRTTILVGGILAGVGAGVAVALKSGGGGDEGKGPPQPAPINRIPIRIWGFSF